jgi:hypothetical protein
MTSADRAEAEPATGRPALSVVVTIVDGGDALARFLDAMAVQRDAPALEVLVPFDASLGSLATLRADHPTVRWLDLGQVPTARPVTGAGGQHELYDRRRSAALHEATGEIVAILEDRGVPRPDWAATACRLHAEPAAVIGGAIEPTPGRLVEWALHVCDFSRYSLPFPHGPAAWVSDVNVTYKRRALSATRHLWADRFHEPAVHWELERLGETLVLSPDLVVEHHRRPKPIMRLLGERFHWGRLFGYIRAGELSAVRRAVLVLSAPLVPLLVAWRHARVWRRRGEALRFVAALPIILALLVAWAIGEAVGTATGRA